MSLRGRIDGRLCRTAAALVLALGVVFAVAGCSLLGGASNVPVATDKPPTGTDGAVDFDGGFIAAGNGAKKVDLWFDAMCPVCGAFEKANGATLASAVDDGSITLRLHPLTFLDAASNGTGYSTRAAAALTAGTVACWRKYCGLMPFARNSSRNACACIRASSGRPRRL